METRELRKRARGLFSGFTRKELLVIASELKKMAAKKLLISSS
jgi:hypothetical protein